MANHVYIDKEILLNQDVERFLEQEAYQKKVIHLYLRDISEKEEVATIDSFGYIADIVYGIDKEYTILASIRNLGLRPKCVSIVNTTAIGKLKACGYKGSVINPDGDYIDLSSYIAQEEKLLRYMNYMFAFFAITIFLSLSIGLSTVGIYSNIFLVMTLLLLIFASIYMILYSKRGYRSIVVIYLLDLLS